MQFLQCAHPPTRKYNGHRPRVHRGFLQTWRAGNINEKVLAHVKALVESAEDPSVVEILVTGHSLGGAVAQLAAFDIATNCNVSTRQVCATSFMYAVPRSLTGLYGSVHLLGP